MEAFSRRLDQLVCKHYLDYILEASWMVRAGTSVVDGGGNICVAFDHDIVSTIHVSTPFARK